MKHAKLAAALAFTASLLAFAAFVVNSVRGREADLGLLGGGAAMVALGFYYRRRIPPN